VVGTVSPAVTGSYFAYTDYTATATVNIGGYYNASCYMAVKTPYGETYSRTPLDWDVDFQGSYYRDMPVTMNGVFSLEKGSVIEVVCSTSGPDTMWGNQITALQVGLVGQAGDIARAHHVKAAVNARGQRVK
jgi:hypothetical protein